MDSFIERHKKCENCTGWRDEMNTIIQFTGPLYKMFLNEDISLIGNELFNNTCIPKYKEIQNTFRLRSDSYKRDYYSIKQRHQDFLPIEEYLEYCGNLPDLTYVNTKDLDIAKIRIISSRFIMKILFIISCIWLIITAIYLGINIDIAKWLILGCVGITLVILICLLYNMKYTHFYKVNRHNIMYTYVKTKRLLSNIP